MFKRSLTTAVCASMLLGGIAIGCDKELEHTKSVEQNGDKTTVKEKTVSEKPNGDIVKQESKSVDHN